MKQYAGGLVQRGGKSDRIIARWLKYFPNCKCVKWTDESTGDIHPHFFIPFINYVFDYLLKNQIKIVFFSSGVAERNTYLIQTYFSELLGIDTYNELYKRGQFSVFSREHLVHGTYGQQAKDLVAIGLQLNECVLVEDDASYIAKGQDTIIKLASQELEWLYYTLRYRKTKLRLKDPQLYFTLNHGLYLIGVISTALEAMNDIVSFRQAFTNLFEELLRNEEDPAVFHPGQIYPP